MSAALEARVVISAEDRTKATFESVKAQIAGINKVVEVMNRTMGAVGPVARNIGAVSGQIGQTSSALARMGEASRSVSTVATAIGNVERSASGMTAGITRSTAAVAKLSSELFDAGAKLKAIETFRSSSRAVDDTSLAMRKAQQDVRRLGAEVAAAEHPTKSLQSAFDLAKADVIQTSAAFRQQGAAAREARAALETFGVPVNKIRSEEERLKAVVESTTAAIKQQVAAEREAASAAEAMARGEAQAGRAAERQARDQHMLQERMLREEHRLAEQRAHGIYHESFTRYALTSAAMAVGAGEVVGVGKEAWAQGAELQHERLGLQNAGRTPQEVQEIEAAARRVVSTLPTASFTEAMKVVAETTQAFGSVEHAVNNLPFMMRTMAILKAAGGEHIHGSAGDVGRALAKTFEERQTKPEEFEHEAAMMIPAMVASGGTFNPEQLYAFAQQAKSALPSLSMRFLSRIAPSLIGAQGGDRAGTALNAFESLISGKANDKKQAEEWLKLGLLDPKQVIMKAGHATSWKSGAVKDTFLAMTDPLAWAEKYLIPALQKQGVDTNNREAVKQILDTMFRNQNANVFASEITQAASRARLHKDEDLINRVGTESEIYKRNLSDFGEAAGALKTALGNLAAAATAPLMRSTATALSGLATILNKVAEFGFRHPTLAAGAGIATGVGALYGAGRVSYAIMNGFGLRGSAAALDAAAAHLMEVGGFGGAGPGGVAGRAVGAAETAAEGAGGGALLGHVVNGGPGVAGAPIYAAPTLAIPDVAAAVTAGMGLLGAAAVAELVKKSFESQEPGKGGQWAPPTKETEPLDKAHLSDEDAEIADLKAKITREQSQSKLLPGEESPNLLAMRDRLAQLQGQADLRRSRLEQLDGDYAREAARARALSALPRPEEFGPELPPGWSHEQFGPYMPHPDDDRLSRARSSDAAGLFGSGRILDGNALHRDDARVLSPSSAGPVPVTVVNPPPAAPSVPDHWLDGGRPGIEERARRGAQMFRQDPEGTRGQHWLDHDAEISPHVDTNGLQAVGEKAQEAQQHLAALAGMSVDIHVGMAQLDALIAKAAQAKASLASLGGGTSGSLGPSYPQTAPAGRRGAVA